MAAVYDLAIAEPHDDAFGRLTPIEWIVYSRGYYCALATAMKVMQHAVTRFKLVTSTRAKEAWKRRKANAGG